MPSAPINSNEAFNQTQAASNNSVKQTNEVTGQIAKLTGIIHEIVHATSGVANSAEQLYEASNLA